MSTLAKKTMTATSVNSTRSSTNASPSAAWAWSGEVPATLARPNPNHTAGLLQAGPLSPPFFSLHITVADWSDITFLQISETRVRR